MKFQIFIQTFHPSINMPPYHAKETVKFIKYKNVQTSADGATPVMKIGKKEVPVFSHRSPTDFLYFIQVLHRDHPCMESQ
jgi:hypothetical protein